MLDGRAWKSRGGWEGVASENRGAMGLEHGEQVDQGSLMC